MYLVTADILLFNYAFSYCNCVDCSVRFYPENYQKMILDFEKSDENFLYVLLILV